MVSETSTPMSRRRLMQTAAAMGFGTMMSGRGHSQEIDQSEIIHQSVTTIARRIRARQITSREVVSAFLSRIEQVNGQINAVVQLRAKEAMDEARACDDWLSQGKPPRGRLHGVPFTVKDSFDTAGLISSAGTEGRSHHVPKSDATVVKRLRAAGAILLGKTNTPELTLSYNTFNQVYGVTHNPYDLSCTPGGSSGGSAAILAASGSPLDIGSDSAGSLRVPASFCGVAAIKPTVGRVPRTGHIISFEGPLQALTTVGPMARFVGDLQAVLPIIAGVDEIDPHVVPVSLKGPAIHLEKLRVAYFTHNGHCTASDETTAAIKATAAALEPRLGKVAPAFPKILNEAFVLYGQLIAADGFDWVKRNLERSGTTKSNLGIVRNPPLAKSSSELVRLIEAWDEVKSHAAKIWQAFDAIICPISAAPAHRLDTQATKLGFSFAPAINVLGWPSVAIRAGTSSKGLPIGVQVIAPMWRDDRALAIAQIIEQASGGWQPIQNPHLRSTA